MRIARGASDSLGPFEIRAASAREVSGLTASKDPGFPIAIASFVVILFGLLIAVLQVRRT